MRFFCRFVALLTVAVVSARAFAGTPAQDTQMTAAAAQIASALSESKDNSVIVFEFSGPDGKVTALGNRLADDFSTALAANPHIRVADRARIGQMVSTENYLPAVIHIPHYDVLIASKLNIEMFVDGTISIGGDIVTVSVTCKRTEGSAIIAKSSFSAPITPTMANLLSETLAEPPVPPYLDPDQTGYTAPKCISCPNAPFTDEAVRSGVEGEVMLEAVVDTDGQVRELRVIKPLSHGLTESALHSVSKWKLSPALRPDGRPMPVRVVIRQSFERLVPY